MRPPQFVGVLAGLLLVCAALAGPLVAPAAAAPEDCFDGGRELNVGTEGPTIDLTIHTSLFTNLGSPGAFGMSAVGSTGEARIVDLVVGVAFLGVGNANEFLANPFSRFALVFDYTLSLPMLATAPGDTTYEQSEAPVEGVPEAECSIEAE